MTKMRRRTTTPRPVVIHADFAIYGPRMSYAKRLAARMRAASWLLDGMTWDWPAR